MSGSLELLILVANTTTAIDITEIIKNEILRLDASAMNPINGGASKSPRKPSDETAVSAVPGAIVFDLPAALYTIGTTDDTPIPMRKNPIKAGNNCGNITESSKPAVVNAPLS
jgi:hypothetical protein